MLLCETFCCRCGSGYGYDSMGDNYLFNVGSRSIFGWLCSLPEEGTKDLSIASLDILDDVRVLIFISHNQ